MRLCGVLEVMVEISSPGYPPNTHTGQRSNVLSKSWYHHIWFQGHTCCLNSLRHRPDACSNTH